MIVSGDERVERDDLIRSSSPDAPARKYTAQMNRTRMKTKRAREMPPPMVPGLQRLQAPCPESPRYQHLARSSHTHSAQNGPRDPGAQLESPGSDPP